MLLYVWFNKGFNFAKQLFILKIFMKKKILIVDDDKFMRELLIEKLSVVGYEVSSVSEGILALSLIKENKPDLILLDILLPGLSGLETLNVLRADDESLHIPIILISRLDEPELIRTAKRLGADDYLVKPFTAETLIEKIKNIPGFGN